MTILLDWTATGPDGAGSVGPPAPCVLCRVPTILRSPKGKPCHKVCAERWTDTHAAPPQPDAPADSALVLAA
jgi:hypothetical protein